MKPAADRATPYLPTSGNQCTPKFMEGSRIDLRHKMCLSVPGKGYTASPVASISSKWPCQGKPLLAPCNSNQVVESNNRQSLQVVWDYEGLLETRRHPYCQKEPTHSSIRILLLVIYLGPSSLLAGLWLCELSGCNYHCRQPGIFMCRFGMKVSMISFNGN